MTLYELLKKHPLPWVRHYPLHGGYVPVIKDAKGSYVSLFDVAAFIMELSELGKVTPAQIAGVPDY